MASRSLPRLLALTVIALCGALSTMFAQTAFAQQQLPYSVELEDQSTATLKPGGYIEFHMSVKNLTDGALKLNVARSTNEVPDHDWSTSICYDDLCFPDTMSFPPALQFKAGQTRLVKVNVLAGNVLDTRARVVLQFSMFGGSNLTEKEFNVTVSNASGVTPAPTAIAAGSWPNPATSFTMIPLVDLHGGAVALTLHDPLGRVVADLSSIATEAMAAGQDAVRIPVTQLASGTYRFMLRSAEHTATGAVVVVH